MAPFRVQTTDGRQEGPLEWEQLKQAVYQKKFSADALVTDIPSGQEKRLSDIPELADLLNASTGSSAIIPIHNKPALIGYYLGLFSLLACVPLLGILGIIMAVAAFVLGIKGLRLARERPEVHGTVHAWIGVVGGLVCGVLGLIINVIFIIGMLSSSTW